MLIDGKLVKKQILESVKKDLIEIKKQLGLTIIQVGNDSASNVYIKNKEKLAVSLGINFKHLKLEETITEEKLLDIIRLENEDELVDGLLVQMPIPEHLDSSKVQNAIIPTKDIDGLTDLNAGMLVHNKECIVPCTAAGVIDMLKYYDINLEGKNVCIVGRSNLVGKPLVNLFMNNNATVTLCHSKTKDIKNITSKADILVAAVGIKHFIKEDMVKEGAVVIDVGINVEDKLYGDVDFDNVEKKASYITPVPGGVGQVTTAYVVKNLVKCYKLSKHI